MTKKTTINRAIIAILAFSLIMPALYAIQPANASTNTPSDFTATAISSSRIDLAWTKNSSADTTYIERNTVVSWSRGEGTLIYNNTGTSYSDTGLDPDTTYYYQAWSYNATDNEYSAVSWTAIELDGANDDVRVPDDSSLNLTSSFTIDMALWMEDTPATGKYDAIISKMTDANTGWGVGLYSDDGTTWELHICVDGHNQSVGIASIPLLKWVYPTVVFNNSTHTMHIYINGNEIYSYSEPNTPSSNMADVVIGECSYVGNDKTFDGKMNYIRVYNKTLTEQQIKYNFYWKDSDCIKDGLVSWWKFNENTGTTASDSWGSNDGTLEDGASWETGTVEIFSSDSATTSTNPYGTISYNSATNTITITGNSSDGDAWCFYDIWRWANIGPGTFPNLVISSNSNATHEGTQYLFSCKLQIGDGSTETWFKDIGKQVTFGAISTADFQTIILLKNNAHFTLGTVIDEENKITSNGCSIYGLDTYRAYLIKGESGSYCYLYSSTFGLTKATKSGSIFLQNSKKIWNCILSSELALAPFSLDTDIYNIDIQHVYYNAMGNPLGNFSDVKISDAAYGFFLSADYDFAAKNIVANVNTYLLVGDAGWDSNFYLIDSVSNKWKISWVTGCEGTFYRQYTFNPIITYVNGSSVAYAHVILKDRYNNTIIDDYTDSNGRILNGTEPYVVTYAFYNQTGGNTPYLQGPHHLTITKAGYATYEANITIDHPVIDDAFVLGSDLQAEIYNYLQQKWGNYNASQFWNYLQTIDANLTDVYNLLQLTDGNLTDVMNLLQSPFAQYTYDIQGCNIRFYENAFDWNGYITNYTWDFGDGNISYKQNPLHSYNSVGYYNVTLTVTDNESKSSNVTHMINVTSACPFPPLLVSPKNNSNDADKDVLLSVYVYDPSDNPMTVTFYQYNATGNDTVIGTCNGISGQEASIIWKDRTVGQTYQWYAIASDGTHNATSGIFSFTVGETQINVSQTAFYGGLILFIGMAAIGEYAYRKSEKKTTILFALVALVSFLNVYLVWNWKWMVTFYILTTLLYSLRWAFSRVSRGEL